MPDNLQEDLCEILVTGAGKEQVRGFLLSKGYDSDVVENELSQILFADEKDKISKDSKSYKISKTIKIILAIGVLLIFVGFVFTQFRKPTYAIINVEICNTSQTAVEVETNLEKELNGPYLSGGCLGVVIDSGLPTDYLYSEQLYIKISVNGKSQTFSNINLGAFSNMFSRAQIDVFPGKESFFSNQEIHNVTYTITSADVAECK